MTTQHSFRKDKGNLEVIRKRETSFKHGVIKWRRKFGGENCGYVKQMDDCTRRVAKEALRELNEKRHTLIKKPGSGA